MKVSFVARFVALALITLGAVSQAQMANFTTPIEIASGPVSERGLVLDPGIAVDTDGTVYVVYADLKDNKDVWLRTLSGTPLAAGAPVNVSNTPKISIQPEVAVSGGRVCVAWQEGDPGSLEISVACSDDGGKTFGAGVNVSKSPSVDSGVITLGDGVWDGNLDIAMDKNKNIYVVWADDRDLRFSKSSDGKT
ncbi:exo-alpha-sialidase, partial [Candidatus Acetothermia bacterium]|nr:exo-alpha-sialidase [Candidatus Acetothermia bacterium]